MAKKTKRTAEALPEQEVTMPGLQPEIPKGTKVTEHKLVPKHEILSAEEKRRVLSEYNATEEQFPFLFSTDAVVKEIQAKPGDMVQILRGSYTAGQTVYYRLVVEAV